MWTVTEDSFIPKSQNHKETVYTIGNGYFCSRGAFEEFHPGERRASFIHGVFDDAPIVVTELANAPDWLPVGVLLNGERFAMHSGVIESFTRSLDLRTGVLSRTVRWRSPAGDIATLQFERFCSLADEHTALIRCHVKPEFNGTVEIRLGLNSHTDNDGLAHWHWLEQGHTVGLTLMRAQTRKSKVEVALAQRAQIVMGEVTSYTFWDTPGQPTDVLVLKAKAGEDIIVDKLVGIATSRDDDNPSALAKAHVTAINDWASAFKANAEAWAKEWARCDVEIDGDDEAQIALRFNIFQILIAGPRHDDRVNIGAKTLSGFGYRGHAFWDTEIFMLPFFIYTAPHIAKNLLNYRYYTLPAARHKAKVKGTEGAFFAWESADTGEEVTPVWVPDFHDKTKLARVWTGDLAIHISADVAFAVYQYWQVTGDDEWFRDRGAELILDTAKYYGARAEWNAAQNRYNYTDVLGPDEYHDHVNNNAYTNRLAQWNLQAGLDTLAWLQKHAPDKATALVNTLDLTDERLARWQAVIEKVHLHIEPNGLIEQFEGYFSLQDVNLDDYEPRTKSMHEIFGIEAANHYQILKQPDVIQVQYILRDYYSEDSIRANYNYYTPRTDHTYGSSLGPSIQAAVACWMGYPEEAYEHFIRAVRADLRDVRSNAGDGIHAASAAGTWQTVVFGFAGLRLTENGYTTTPHLPQHWKRLKFKFFQKGVQQEVEITQ